MTQGQAHELLKLTAEYRREASILCSSSRQSENNNGIVVDIESSLGLHALSSPEPPTMDIPASFFHCHCCGCVMQPGTNGTTLRVHSVGRGRTRRRRASRKRAREFQSKKQASASGGRTWRQDSHQNGGIRKEEEDFLCVTDGTCRNAVVVTCGSCGWKLKYKGMPPNRQTQKKPSIQPPKQKNGETVPASRQQKRKQSDNLGDGDLVSLPKQRAGEGKRRKGGKKKPKMISNSKQGQDKSRLLDFLSTLNDS